MRTSPVALAHLHDSVALVEAAVAVSDLTHADPVAGGACALWCLAIRHAVLHAELVIRSGLEHLPTSSRSFWAVPIEEAEQQPATDFAPNGYVVSALQAAWSAIVHTQAAPRRFLSEHVMDGLEAAIRIGDEHRLLGVRRVPPLRHPSSRPGVYLSGAARLSELPEDVTAVVSFSVPDAALRELGDR